MFCKCTVKPWSCDIFWGGYWTVPTIIKTQQVKDSAYFHNSLHSTNLKNLSSYLILDFYKTEELLKDRFRDDVSTEAKIHWLFPMGQAASTFPIVHYSVHIHYVYQSSFLNERICCFFFFYHLWYSMKGL